MCKKPCKECPWVNNNRYSLDFRIYVSKMNSVGLQNHACHMITSDIWGFRQPLTDKNICRGQKKINT